MSIAVMTEVWRLELPRAQQLVLLVMADHARDDGTKCFPSVLRIMWKTGYSKSQVYRILRELEDAGLLERVREGGGRGMATEYRVVTSAGTPKISYEEFKLQNGVTMTPFTGDDEDGDVDHAESQTVSPMRKTVSPMRLNGVTHDTPTIIEPSLQPSGKTVAPAGATARRDRDGVQAKEDKRAKRRAGRGGKVRRLESDDLAEQSREAMDNDPEMSSDSPLADKEREWRTRPVQEWSGAQFLGYFTHTLAEARTPGFVANREVNKRALGSALRKLLRDGIDRAVLRAAIDKFALEPPVSRVPAWQVFIRDRARLLGEGERIVAQARPRPTDALEMMSENARVVYLRQQARRLERKRQKAGTLPGDDDEEAAG